LADFCFARAACSYENLPIKDRECSVRAFGAFAFTLLPKGFIMSIGTVKWFNSTKGFGFIQPDNGGVDVFVHISAVERAGLGNIVEGQRLGYEIVHDRKSGKMAADQLQAA
jgi:CspA family cold shock protein